MDQEVLQQLFAEQIRDIYDAEKQLVKALPKMAKAAESEELADAINTHLQETQNQVARLEEVFKALKAPARGKPCKAMKGLIEEANETIQEEDKGPMRDLAIIAGGQRIEHYEISAYGTVRTLAEHLEMSDVVKLLQKTEDEEKQADHNLTEVASSIYASGDEEEGDEEESDEDMEEEEDSEGELAAPARSRRATATASASGRKSARK